MPYDDEYQLVAMYVCTRCRASFFICSADTRAATEERIAEWCLRCDAITKYEALHFPGGLPVVKRDKK